jgi:hypothetical protein
MLRPLGGEIRPPADRGGLRLNGGFRLAGAVRIWRTNVGRCQYRSVSASRVADRSTSILDVHPVAEQIAASCPLHRPPSGRLAQLHQQELVVDARVGLADDVGRVTTQGSPPGSSLARGCVRCDTGCIPTCSLLACWDRRSCRSRPWTSPSLWLSQALPASGQADLHPAFAHRRLVRGMVAETPWILQSQVSDAVTSIPH